MSDPTPLTPEAIIAKIDRAWQEVSDLCSGKRRWTMTVPAERDRDSDLVIGDALTEARRYLDAARAAAPEPCGYCGSVDGLTPPTVSLSDPMTGETLRRLIDEVTGGLSDPRLHEVDWEAVAALAGSVDPAPGDQTVAEYVLAMMLEFQRMYGQLRKVPVEAVRMMLVKAATGRFAALAQPAPEMSEAERKARLSTLRSTAPELLAQSAPEAPGYYCTVCPHAMFLHDEDGSCGCGVRCREEAARA